MTGQGQQDRARNGGQDCASYGHEESSTELVGERQPELSLRDRLGEVTGCEAKARPPNRDADGPRGVIACTDVLLILEEERLGLGELAKGDEWHRETLPGMHGLIGEPTPSRSCHGGA